MLFVMSLLKDKKDKMNNTSTYNYVKQKSQIVPITSRGSYL